MYFCSGVDTLTCAIEDLPKTRVPRTVFDGVDVFDTKTLPRLDEDDRPATPVSDLA